MFPLVMFVGLWSTLSDETLFMPPPTKDITAKIALLGDPDFRTREKADKELRDLGWTALKGLYTTVQETSDPEIRMRAERIYGRYFYVPSDDKDFLVPGIWHMDEKLRYPDGFKLELGNNPERMGSCCGVIDKKDVARQYYERVLRERNLFDEKGVSMTGFRDEEIARSATVLYMRQQLLRGEKRENIKKQMNAWAKNSQEYCHYYQTENLQYPDGGWNHTPPGPMIKKDDFKEPMWGP